jgi:dTDP-glucose pyrophosphorylase
MNANLPDILIQRGATVKDAMKQLDRTAQKIVFVVDSDGRLIGSLTDGDIRRRILAGGTIEDPVEKACFKKTFFANKDYDLEEVKKEIFKRKIVIVPIVNEQRKIIEILKWDSLFGASTKRKIAEKLTGPVVIMAGGKGTRLDPFTKILPKPLIPIGDKTIIEIIIDKFLAYRVDHFYISVNHKAKIIKSYFEELAPPYQITFLQEDTPLGTVGALKQLQRTFEGSLLMTNCDVIIDADYDDIERHHARSGNDITLVASHKNFSLPYGICEIEKGGRLKRINEKPEYSFLANTGMYFIKEQVLRFIPPDQPFHVTQLIEKVIEKKGQVGVYPIGEGSWIDTGEWSEYKKAIERLRY